jgi:hypothetical protein
MSELNEKLIEAVAKLIKLTQENKIKWASDAPTDNQNRNEEEYVETVFLTNYDNKNLRLYSKSYKVDAIPFTSVFLFGSQKPKWTTKTTLEILDSNHNAVWTFPSLAPLSDLLMSVRYQVADVDDFIEGLLNNSDNKLLNEKN